MKKPAFPDPQELVMSPDSPDSPQSPLSQELSASPASRNASEDSDSPDSPDSPDSSDSSDSPGPSKFFSPSDIPALVELDYLLDHLTPEDTDDLSPEELEAGLIGEWTFFARCVRDDLFGWKPDTPPPGGLFAWRFYPEGLLWEEGEGADGEWFPYSVYRATRELFIVRDPRVESWREERYLLGLLSRRFLWLYDLCDTDSEEVPQRSLLFWRREKQPAEPVDGDE